MLTECQIFILFTELSIWNQCRINQFQTWNQSKCIIFISWLHSAGFFNGPASGSRILLSLQFVLTNFKTFIFVFCIPLTVLTVLVF